MMEAAQAALAAKQEVVAAGEHLKELAQTHATLVRQAAVVGWATACVLWVHLGDPADYHCAEAYRKAMGLNLKERSSGRYQGRATVIHKIASACPPALDGAKSAAFLLIAKIRL